jgi:S1-C subfamily serine protease
MATCSFPSDLLEPILDDLLRTGRSAAPPRPWLGMYTADSQGRLVVNGLAAGGPAERAGVATGDLVVAVGGERVGTLADLFRQIWRQGPAGTEIALTVALQRSADPSASSLGRSPRSPEEAESAVSSTQDGVRRSPTSREAQLRSAHRRASDGGSPARAARLLA